MQSKPWMQVMVLNFGKMLIRICVGRPQLNFSAWTFRHGASLTPIHYFPRWIKGVLHQYAVAALSQSVMHLIMDAANWILMEQLGIMCIHFNITRFGHRGMLRHIWLPLHHRQCVRHHWSDFNKTYGNEVSLGSGLVYLNEHLIGLMRPIHHLFTCYWLAQRGAAFARKAY